MQCDTDRINYLLKAEAYISVWFPLNNLKKMPVIELTGYSVEVHSQ